MKEIRKTYFFFILFCLLVVGQLSAQEKVTATINVFEPLPEVPFAAFLTNPFIQGTPRIMQIQLSPHGQDVILIGNLTWRKPGQSNFEHFMQFKTKPFKSRDFYNDQINSDPDIQIDDTDYNDDLVEENLKLGKPTGLYKLFIKVYDVNMQLLDEEIVDLGIGKGGFVNPSQTLEFIQPYPGSYHDAGGVLLTWSEVIGVTDFIILANERKSKDESLEEALKKGNPIVNNKKVGLRTSVNLREVLDRELVPGQEIVAQVRGIIPNPGGEKILYSEIINFYITDPNTNTQENILDNLILLLEKVIDDIKSDRSKINPEEKEDVNRFVESLEELLEKLRSGEITFDELSVTLDSGLTLTYPEFIQLLEKLVQYPNLITNINFEEK
ncbi:MAG: hypothetical protein ABFS12_14070 [Bacteroidota bacterium]